MSLDNGVTVLSIMGNDYSVKAPVGEENTLQQAAAMLTSSLAETKRQYPALLGERLLVLAALNLCSKQLQLEKKHKVELEGYQQQVKATVEAISRTISQA